MKILKSDLEAAAQKGIISSQQSNDLWAYLESLTPDQAKFQMLHVLYYFGGLLIFASMTWFLTNAWNDGAAVMLTSGLFAAVYLGVGHNLWAKQNLKTAGGLLITAAVGLTPVFVYGLQRQLDIWPDDYSRHYSDFPHWIKSSWFYIEVSTIAASLFALRYYKFTFLTFPLALALWVFALDLSHYIYPGSGFSSNHHQMVSCVFGLFVLAGSYIVDLKNTELDFAFWTYLYGALAFWGGLSLMDSDSELGKFIYCMINVAFIFLSVYLRRKIFMICGSIGVLFYVGRLAWKIFKDSYAFPIILSLIGLGIVFLAVKYQKNKQQVEAKIESLLPSFLMKWRPLERR